MYRHRCSTVIENKGQHHHQLEFLDHILIWVTENITVKISCQIKHVDNSERNIAADLYSSIFF